MLSQHAVGIVSALKLYNFREYALSAVDFLFLRGKALILNPFITTRSF